MAEGFDRRVTSFSAHLQPHAISAAHRRNPPVEINEVGQGPDH
jgi:hypothetical protein